MKKYFLAVIVILIFSVRISGQSPPFQILVEPMSVPDLPGLHSFAFGQADGKWLIIGGRIDGLHMRQPFGAFRAAGRNILLTVVDPVLRKIWQTPVSVLSTRIREQLGSTNMQFHQDGDMLYLIGGYGYSDSLKRFITFDNLTVIHISETIQGIINEKNISNWFRQISDTAFAVTGGHLKKLGETYYLVGGQKFEGRYNPMGPDHGPGFFQQYTDQIRKFKLVENSNSLQIKDYSVITDASVFHRRDYNVVPQMLEGNREGLTIFSGVFQQDYNIPFLNSTTIAEKKYSVDRSFAQYYNHYHCAVLPLHSDLTGEMHTVFFGGIAQYYDSSGILVQSDEVPFVKTIARVTRDQQGRMAEFKLPVEMPALLGAGAEFIISPGISSYQNGVIKLDELDRDTTFVGYVFGGIASSAPNVFFINTGSESTASSSLFKIYILKNTASTPHLLNTQSNNGLQLQVFPIANDDVLRIQFNLEIQSPVEIIISNEKGEIIRKEILKGGVKGKNLIRRKLQSMKPGDIFWVTLKTSKAESTQKIVVEP